MNERLFAFGSAVAALLASLCCLGPLVLGGLGLGAVVAAAFAPLRWYFLALSAVLLGLGFFVVYRRPQAVARCQGEACAADNRLGSAKLLLGVAAAAALALGLFPLYGGRLVPAPRTAQAVAPVGLETVELRIEGMDCEACASLIRDGLLRTHGVAAARVDYAAGRAAVQYDPTQTGPDKLVEAVRATGYQAQVAPRGE